MISTKFILALCCATVLVVECQITKYNVIKIIITVKIINTVGLAVTAVLFIAS